METLTWISCLSPSFTEIHLPAKITYIYDVQYDIHCDMVPHITHTEVSFCGKNIKDLLSSEYQVHNPAILALLTTWWSGQWLNLEFILDVFPSACVMNEGSSSIYSLVLTHVLLLNPFALWITSPKFPALGLANIILFFASMSYTSQIPWVRCICLFLCLSYFLLSTMPFRPTHNVVNVLIFKGE